MEEVNIENLKRTLRPPVSTISGFIGFVVATALFILMIESISGWIVGALGDNALQIIVLVMIAFIGFITIDLSSASGSVLGRRLFRGNKKMSRGFRLAIGVVQACLLAASIGLVIIMVR